MVEIKQSRLDELCEDFEQMKYKAEGWWPTIEEIDKYIKPRFKSSLEFALWITETAGEPQTEEEKAAKKHLLDFIYKNLVITDDMPKEEKFNA